MTWARYSSTWRRPGNRALGDLGARRGVEGLDRGTARPLRARPYQRARWELGIEAYAREEAAERRAGEIGGEVLEFDALMDRARHGELEVKPNQEDAR